MIESFGELENFLPVTPRQLKKMDFQWKLQAQIKRRYTL